jgi:phage tail protein X
MDRYKHTIQLKDKDGYRYKSSTIYPTIPPSRDDIYLISRDGDRLDILANKYYGDITLWWMIAISNNLGKGTMVVPTGIRLRIPMDIKAFKQGLEQNNKR